MPPRLHVSLPLAEGTELTLPAGAARHVQVLRLQPGDAVTLFNGNGGEHAATVLRMGRSDVTVAVGALAMVDRELPVRVTLALGMPANDRMDALVEKASELGVAVIQPLLCERSVLRLSGDRAEKRREHWQGIAVAAAEQSGRTRVPVLAPVVDLSRWMAAGPRSTAEVALRWMLSFADDALPLAAAIGSWDRGASVDIDGRAGLDAGSPPPAVIVLSGPEGGLSPAEEDAARAAGFRPVGLGCRVLRADTAPLAVLACLGLDTDGESDRGGRGHRVA